MSEKTTFWIIFSISTAFSVGWFLFCVSKPTDAPDAGRGGAIGTALSLLLFFVNRNYALHLFNVRNVKLPELQRRIIERKNVKEGRMPDPRSPSTLADVEERLDDFLDALESESKVHAAETKFVFVATTIGTIFWGFGDWFACLWTTGHLHCAGCQ